MSTPRVSVIVPSFQRRASLERLLRALGDQTLPCDRYEVLVTLDGSTDGSREMLEALRTPYALGWRWQPNAGRAAACNASIARARGDLLVLLDDDMEPARELLEAHLARHPAGTRRAVIGAAPITLDNNASAVARYVAEKFNQHVRTLGRADRAFALRDFYSGNCSIRRELLREVGAFDEAFRIYGNEDLELCWRLRRAGVEILFSPEALAFQHYTKDVDGLVRDTFAKGQTAVLLARKHPEALAELKLGSSGGSARRRRLLRALLAASRVLPAMPAIIARSIGVASLLPVPGLARAYGLTIDYFYWLGAAQAGASPAASGPARQQAPSCEASRGAAGEPEAARNRRLRRVDWRFLLSSPRPRVAVYFAGRGHDADELRDALASMSDTVVEPALARDGRCDLAVVATGSDERTLRSAAARLRPGGSCYVERRGPSARASRLREQLAAAGFEEVRTYWPWPSVHRCRAWIPLDDAALAERYLREEGQGGLGVRRRVTRTIRRGVARFQVRWGLTGYVCGIGRAVQPRGLDAAPSTGAARGFMEIVRTQWPRWGLGPVDPRLSCVLETGGARSINKAVGLVFAGDDRQPRVVVKIARVSEAAEGLAREASMLRAVEAIDRPVDRSGVLPDPLMPPAAPIAQVPRVLFCARASDELAVGETALPGRPITGRLARDRYDVLARRATDWLITFARMTREEGSSWENIRTSCLARFDASFGEIVEPAVTRHIHAALADLRPPPAVCEHRDFSPWNVLVQADGALAVLDWESAERRGVPALDLIYFLSYLTFYRDGLLGWRRGEPTVARYCRSYRGAWDGATAAGAVNQACLREYARHVGVEPRALPALRLFTWLLHARSEYTRAAADQGQRPPPGRLRTGIFVNLLEEEARRWPSSS